MNRRLRTALSALVLLKLLNVNRVRRESLSGESNTRRVLGRRVGNRTSPSRRGLRVRRDILLVTVIG